MQIIDTIFPLTTEKASSSGKGDHPLPSTGKPRTRYEQILFFLTMALGASIIWLTKYPPMIDLPQHVAQLAVIGDIFTGMSPWKGDVQINWMTPYYAANLPAFMLLVFFSPLTAVKIVMTMAYLGFVSSILHLFRYFQISEAMNWPALPTFFGLAWFYGFTSFLVAAPLCIFYIIAAARYARTENPTCNHMIRMAFYGVGLFFSHGLVFLFAVFIAGLFVLERTRLDIAKGVSLIRPYLLLAVLVILYYKANSIIAPTMADDRYVRGLVEYRIAYLVMAIMSVKFELLSGSTAMALLVLPAVITFDERRSSVLQQQAQEREAKQLPPPGRLFKSVPLAGLAVFWAILPHEIWGGTYMFERFALFTVPFWVIALAGDSAAEKHKTDSPVLASLLKLAVILALGIQMQKVYSYSARTASIQELVDALPAGKRVIQLIGDSDKSIDDYIDYIYDPNWYQAEKGGWVDPNFALCRPEILRHREGSKLSLLSNWMTIKDMEALGTPPPTGLFDYIVIHDFIKIPEESFVRTRLCYNRTIGHWRIYTNPPCKYSAQIPSPP